jgi:tRNA threonylcarbamoyladenosine biosynthesis protein TsaB
VVRFAEGARRHTSLLVGLTDQALGALGATLDQVEAIAVSDGPGSFTGLRVAAAWAKGLVRARSLAFWTASTLLVRARPHARQGEAVLGVGTALRGELYLAGYRFEGTRIATLLRPQVLAVGAEPPGAVPVDVVVADLDAVAVARWRWPGAPRIVGAPDGLPNAAALIALIGLPGGATRVDDPAGWEPWYGRLAEAQVRWEQAHGHPLLDSTGDGR